MDRSKNNKRKPCIVIKFSIHITNLDIITHER